LSSKIVFDPSFTLGFEKEQPNLQGTCLTAEVVPGIAVHLYVHIGRNLHGCLFKVPVGAKTSDMFQVYVDHVLEMARTTGAPRQRYINLPVLPWDIDALALRCVIENLLKHWREAHGPCKCDPSDTADATAVEIVERHT
jgi:hypothetical protein